MTLFVNNGKTATELPSAAGDPIPTSTSWGSNTETLAATKTLTDSSETLQFLDPDGTDRIVNLPSITSVTPFFLIYNSGIGGSSILSVRAAGVVVGEVLPGDQTWVVNDGTTWTVNNFNQVAAGLLSQVFFLGADAATGDFLTLGGLSASAPTATDSHWNKGIALYDGAIDRIAFRQEAVTHSQWYIYVNERVVGEFQISGLNGMVRVPSIGVQAGDLISVERQDGLALETLIAVPIRTNVGGYTVQFGGDLDGFSDRYRPNERPAENGALPAADSYETQFTAIGSGTITRLAFVGVTGGATTSTTLQIRKNGSLAATVTLSGLVDIGGQLRTVETVSVAFVEGDLISVGSPGVSNPTNSGVLLLMSGVEGICYPFGGGVPSANQWVKANGTSADGGDNSLSTDKEHAVVRGGTVTAASNISQNSIGVVTHDLWKNGALSETMDFSTGFSGVDNTLNTPVLAGDRLAIRLLSNSPGQGSFLVQVK